MTEEFRIDRQLERHVLALDPSCSGSQLKLRARLFFDVLARAGVEAVDQTGVCPVYIAHTLVGAAAKLNIGNRTREFLRSFFVPHAAPTNQSRQKTLEIVATTCARRVQQRVAEDTGLQDKRAVWGSLSLQARITARKAIRRQPASMAYVTSVAENGKSFTVFFPLLFSNTDHFLVSTDAGMLRPGDAVVAHCVVFELEDDTPLPLARLVDLAPGTASSLVEYIGPMYIKPAPQPQAKKETNAKKKKRATRTQDAAKSEEAPREFVVKMPRRARTQFLPPPPPYEEEEFFPCDSCGVSVSERAVVCWHCVGLRAMVE